MGADAENAYSLLKDLIRVDTANPPGNEAAAAALLARFLDNNGISTRILEKAPGRSNLVARIEGPAGAPPLLLSAHLDTVPAQEQGWDLPPRSAGEKDGLLYGRGAIDVKNGAAMAAALLVQAKRRGGLKRPLIFAAVADEEVGCALGSRFLAEEHAELVRAEYFLGEGGGMTQWVMGRKIVPIGVAEKGQLLVRLLFEGPGGHASVPNPQDAAFKLGRFLSRLSEGLPAKVVPPVTVFLSELGKARGGLPGLALKLLRFSTAARLSSWVPPPAGPALRAMLSNTASPTRILAEGAVNAIPSAIACELDVRTLPGCSPAEVLEEIWTATGQRPRHEILREAPAVLSKVETPLFQHLCERTRVHVPDAEPLPYLIPGYTDAKWFSRVAAHCYGFLPVLSDDPVEAGRFRTLMHGANERIAKDAFLKGYALYEDAVLSFLQRPC